MYKLKLLVADVDTGYLEKLIQYINSEFSSRLKVMSFSRADLLTEYLASNSESIDILLVHPAFLQQADDKLFTRVRFIAALTEGSLDCCMEGVKSLNKYQPGERLVNQLIQLYSERNGIASEIAAGARETRIISVYSPAGGVGKTSLATGLCFKLSEMGKSVLAVSLEATCSMVSTLPSTGNDAFTYVLLSLTENADILPVTVEAFKTRDYVNNFDFLEPPDNFLELMALGKSGVKTFLEKLKGAGNYDFIIMDTDSGADGKVLTALESSDGVILVEAPDAIYTYKIKVFLEQLGRSGTPAKSITDKIVRVTNQRSGGQNTSFGRCPESGLTIPHIPNLWHYDCGKCIFDPDRSFTNSLAALAEHICHGGNRNSVDII